MKKIFVVIVPLLVISAMLLAACAPAAAPAAPAEPVVVEKTVVVEKVVEKVVEVEKAAPVDEMVKAKEFLAGKKICSVLPGPVNDAGWTTQAYNGLVNLRDNFGMEILYREETKVEEAESVLREFAESGCAIIHAHGFEYSDQIDAVAAEYTEIQFLQTSRCFGKEPNVIGHCYSTGEGGYFLGMMMAQLTKTGKTAWIVGTSYPNLSWQPEMSRQAAKDLGKDIVIDEVPVGSWNDPAKAKELTKALIEQDYDVFVLLADAGDTGTVEAIKEGRKAGKEIKAIAWVKDKNYLGPDFIIGGWEEKAWKQMENGAVAFAKKGAPLGVDMPQGVMEGVASLNPTYGLVPLEVEKQVFDLYKKYIAEGASAIPNIKVRTDL